jgi:hypothetical protein
MKRFDKPDGYLVVSRSKKWRTNAIQDERSKNICTHGCAVLAAHTAPYGIEAAPFRQEPRL